MSLFPSKLRPGGVLTIHLRWSPEAPAWIHRRVFVVDPLGRRTRVLDRLQLSLPTPRSKEDAAVLGAAGERFQATPILVAARYLQSGSRDAGYFAEALRGLRDATHFYVTFAVPEDAPLGRWRVEVEAARDGVVRGSGTPDTDYFFVESLRLVRSQVASGVREVEIDNPSPEAVVAQLAVKDADAGWTSRLVALPPSSATRLSFRGVGLLGYQGGAAVLSLQEPGDPLCVRHPRCVALEKADGAIALFARDGEEEHASLLVGHAAAVWRMSDGFHTRSEIATEERAAAYRDLVEGSLVVECELSI